MYQKTIKIGTKKYNIDFAKPYSNLKLVADVSKAEKESFVSLEAIVLDYNIKTFSKESVVFVIETDKMEELLSERIIRFLILMDQKNIFKRIELELDISEKSERKTIERFLNMISKCDNIHTKIHAYINPYESKEKYEYDDIETVFFLEGARDYSENVKDYSYFDLDDVISQNVDINTINLNNTIITTKYPREIENDLLNEVVYNQLNDTRLFELVNKIYKGTLVCRAALPFYFVISSKGNVRKCKHYETEETIIGQIINDDIIIDNNQYGKWVFSSFDLKCKACYLFPSCMGMACPRLNIQNNKSICPKEKQLLDSLIETNKKEFATTKDDSERNKVE